MDGWAALESIVVISVAAVVCGEEQTQVDRKAAQPNSLAFYQRALSLILAKPTTLQYFPNPVHMMCKCHQWARQTVCDQWFCDFLLPPFDWQIGC